MGRVKDILLQYDAWKLIRKDPDTGIKAGDIVKVSAALTSDPAKLKGQDVIVVGVGSDDVVIVRSKNGNKVGMYKSNTLEV